MAVTLNLFIIRELKYVGFITNNLLLVVVEYIFDVEVHLANASGHLCVILQTLRGGLGIRQQ